jgi:peptide/nickel transport system permease protein
MSGSKRFAPMLWVGRALLAVTAAGVILGPPLFGDAASTFDPRNVGGPSLAHPLGTDSAGRDLFAQLMNSAPSSVLTALVAVGMASVIGVPFGAATALAGRRSRRWLAAALDLSMAVPGLLVAFATVLVLGPGVRATAIAIALAMAPGLARLTMTLSAGVVGRDFVTAARLSGLSRPRVIRRHVLPNIARPLAARIALGVTDALVAGAALSFIGLGVQPPSSDWGRMLNAAVPDLYARPWTVVGPSVAIILVGVAFALLGDRLTDHRESWRQRAPLDGVARPDRQVEELSTQRADSNWAAELRGLTIDVDTPSGWIPAVVGVDIAIAAGERVGLVGESGAGKSLTAMALAGAASETRTAYDEYFVAGMAVPTIARDRRARFFAEHVGVVFQDPGASLNPTRRVGAQCTEVLKVHRKMGRSDRKALALQLFERLGLSASVWSQRPCQLSGGMSQRVAIASAMLASPTVLIADEATTAIDPSLRVDVLSDIRRLCDDEGAGLLLVSHDLGLVGAWCDRVIVMYAGRVVEQLPAAQLSAAQHPYTQALLACVPRIGVSAPINAIPGTMPKPGERLQPGCSFADRCAYVNERCAVEPTLLTVAAQHQVRCWRAEAVQ